MGEGWIASRRFVDGDWKVGNWIKVCWEVGWVWNMWRICLE